MLYMSYIYIYTCTKLYEAGWLGGQVARWLGGRPGGQGWLAVCWDHRFGCGGFGFAHFSMILSGHFVLKEHNKILGLYEPIS